MMLAKPAAPQAAAGPAKQKVSPAAMAPMWLTTGTRPAASSKTVSNTSSRSATDMNTPSPVVPLT